jgi:hypothetical protein
LKAYLITTGSIFGLIALAHLARTIAESQRLAADPWFYLEGPGLGLVAAALSQKRVSGTFTRSKLQHFIGVESSRHLFLARFALFAELLVDGAGRPSCPKFRSANATCSPPCPGIQIRCGGEATNLSPFARSRELLL